MAKDADLSTPGRTIQVDYKAYVDLDWYLGVRDLPGLWMVSSIHPGEEDLQSLLLTWVPAQILKAYFSCFFTCFLKKNLEVSMFPILVKAIRWPGSGSIMSGYFLLKIGMVMSVTYF